MLLGSFGKGFGNRWGAHSAHRLMRAYADNGVYDCAISSTEVAKRFAERGMFVSNGDFYAATVVERLGKPRDGFVRAGCACYTTAKKWSA